MKKNSKKCMFDPFLKPFLPYFCSDMQNGSNLLLSYAFIFVCWLHVKFNYFVNLKMLKTGENMFGSHNFKSTFRWKCWCFAIFTNWSGKGQRLCLIIWLSMNFLSSYHTKTLKVIKNCRLNALWFEKWPKR